MTCAVVVTVCSGMFSHSVCLKDVKYGVRDNGYAVVCVVAVTF